MLTAILLRKCIMVVSDCLLIVPFYLKNHLGGGGGGGGGGVIAIL